MNLTRVLKNALPEIPARTIAERYPRLDPGTTFREHIELGKPIIRIYVPSALGMYRFPPELWRLAQLFDGTRSYAEIAELYSQQNGVEYDEQAVRDFAAELEAGEFWYKTPQEKNILLMQQTAEERRKKLQSRSKWADLSEITFPAFNPDRFLTWVYKYTKFIYTPWFTVLTLIAFAITLAITMSHWSEIGRDTLEFYDFTNKSWADVFILYGLGMFVVATHEFAHAHACKHYGGRVPAMGFALVFLAPAFYTDTTEGAVMATPSQRVVISLAGNWSEFLICSIATPIWWGTPPQTLLHDAAYFTMMMTGFMCIILNWNPLMKLDGYFILCELTGIANLKEDSTAYVSSWVKRHIWRLPVEVPYVPKSRRLAFVIYALLSGAYSYTVLYLVARLAGNIVRNFSPEWGFIPELAVAALIFRSRIRLLVKFMKFVYLDKKDRIIAWFTPRHSIALAGAAALLLGLPLWHDRVSGTFVLEPANTVVTRAHVPGAVSEINASEGEYVEAGRVLATLKSLPMQSEFENARSTLDMSAERVKNALLHYSEYGSAAKEREHRTVEFQQISEMKNDLQIVSPISGIVLTPRVQDHLGAYLNAGSELLEVADLSTMRARIYVSEYDLSKIRRGATGSLKVAGQMRTWDAKTISVAARPTEMDARLMGENQLKGMNPPHFYLVDLLVENPNLRLKPGMSGVARIYGERRSLLAMGWEGFVNFWSRKIW